jgi:heme/copper-type cytochrome/quinol oxidase subunit 1
MLPTNLLAVLRMPVQRLGVAAFWLIFLGFNLTFFLMHLTGLRGMPRRIHSYEAGIGWLLNTRSDAPIHRSSGPSNQLGFS